MGEIKRYQYCLTNIKTSEGACSNPQITWVDKPGVFISCTGTCITVSFSSDYTGDRSVKLFIQCDSCFACEPLERDIRFCSNWEDCGPCEECNADGLCVSRCEEGQVCNEDLDVCVGCTEHDNCEGDKKCVNGECKCPASSPIDLGGGRCGQCVGQADCVAKYGKCVRCVDNQCVPITDCGDGVCDPSTGECAECVGSGDCEGDNKCCVDKQCVCCPGYIYSAATGTCVEAPECTGDDCGPCGVCVLGKCVPRQCPDGKVCVEGECLDKCDCNNPASCTNKGKICKDINGICACVSCGAGCASGCIAGCHCEGTSCVVDPCHGECDNASDCGTGCGCDEDIDSCVQCSQLSCATGECAEVLGCECVNKVCTYTGGRCVGNCDTKGDCGKDCTCHNGKCVPCEFFSCATGECTEKEGCACNGNTCEGDPDYECGDTLEIVKVDATCDIQGELTKDRCCGCPVITVHLDKNAEPVKTDNGNFAGTWALSYRAQLFKGNNIDAANRLDNSSNPNIADNEEASGGTLKLSIITSYLGGEPSTVQNVTSGISTVGVVTFAASIYQMNGKPLGAQDSRRVKDVVFVLMAEGFEFPNTCTYGNTELGRYTVTTNTGFGNVKISDFVSNEDCRDPLFTWYKSSTGNFTAASRIRTVYVPIDSSGKYIDALPDGDNDGGVTYEESCNQYKLEADCSCEPSKSKYIVFCKPTYTAVIKPNTCGKTAIITIPATCHSNIKKDYQLLINGVAVIPNTKTSTNFKLETAIPAFEVTKPEGITSVELKLVCDSTGECADGWKKLFNPDLTPQSDPTAECYTDPSDGVQKIKFTFTNNAQTPWIVGGVSMWVGATVLTAQQEGANKTYFIGLSGIEYNYKVMYPCGDHLGKKKHSCCEAYAPTLTGSCIAGVSLGNLLTEAQGVEYYILGVHPVTKTTLEGIADLGATSLTFKPIGSATAVTILNPGRLGYKPTDSGCQVQFVNIDRGNCCGDCSDECTNSNDNGFMAFPDTTHAVTEGYIVFEEDDFYPPLASGEEVEVSMNNGAYVPYTPGTHISVSVSTNRQNYKIRRVGGCIVCGCFVSDSTTSVGVPVCDIEDDDIVVTEESCKYKVVVPEMECVCNSIAFAPELVDVTTGTFNGQQSIVVSFNAGFFYGETHVVGSGIWDFLQSATIKVEDDNAGTIGQVIASPGGSGLISISVPCKLKDADAIQYTYTYYVLPNFPVLLTRTMRFCVNWPLSAGVTVTGLKIVNNSHSQTLTATSISAGCFEVSGLYIIAGGSDLDVKWQLSDGEEAINSLYAVASSYWESSSNQYVGTSQVCEDCTQISVYASSVTLLNGCEYPREVWKTPFIACITDGNSSEEIPWQSLHPVDGAVRKVKVDFYEDDVMIKTVYTDGGSANPVYLDGTLPANPDGIEFGKAYDVKASCHCEGEKAMDLCINPRVTSAFTTCTSGYYSDGSSILTLTYTLNTCYPLRTIYLYKADGTLIDTATTSSAGNVTDRTVTLTEDMAGLENDFQVYSSFDVSCTGSLYHISRAEVNLTWTVTCAGDNSTFDLTFGGSPTLELISGSGTVVGSTIIGVTNADPISFRGVINSCTSKTYELTYDCTVAPSPSVSRTPSKTPSKSIQGSPSITPSRTVSRSVTPSLGSGGGSIIVGSPSTSRTPSRTSSVTPSGSVIVASPSASPTATPTQGASPSVTPTVTRTPSVSASRTPSLTVSPSEGASPSVTASVTPSITPSITVSRTETPPVTPSVTVSISVTASRTPSRTPTPTPSASRCTVNCIEEVTGYYCGNTVYCCGGVEVDSPTYCCNGTPIDPEAGDVCCQYDPS